ncbi:MAG: hypothetical protein SOV16_01855 [Anaerobiospirillum succiniciproducens]|uniref:hypothetical protein n=1 Tax=Anaerobiospirillum succiniciproducens TaxID=13335 RepID=UPI002A7480F2|nr:hypothetical protein [Anaerobiospirillum succiniciproducens]MDY2797911.1 hypothetical protein [Anaerobiospirillum succiniciproducens]
MFLAKYSHSLISKPQSSVCVISSALAFLLSACSSSNDESNAKASATSSSQADNRIVYMIPDYKGKSCGAQDEDEYLNALQKTDLVFDEDKVQLINIQGAAPSRIVLYKQIAPLTESQDQQADQNDAHGDMHSTDSKDNVAAPAQDNNESPQPTDSDNKSADQEAAHVSSAQDSANVASAQDSVPEPLSLVEVATLAGADSTSATLETPADKVVRVSSLRDTQNNWQKSSKPCYNCTNPTEYDPYYYEPFYKKFPTPGVDKK